MRTVSRSYQCWCVLLDKKDDGTVVRGECKAETSGPDDPFCPDCADRHPNLGVQVTTRQY